MEEKIFITSEDLKLEAAVESVDPVRAGVVVHPHPLYGGSMDNNVVQAGTGALVRSGWTSLRFNFRGVGRSSGSSGAGPKEGDDLVASVSYLKDRGLKKLVVIGYSFGAWITAMAWPRLKALGVEPLVLIAPPAAFMDFQGLDPETEIGLMICGRLDEIAPPDLAEGLGRSLNRPVDPVVLPGADHFFWGHESELVRIVSEHLSGI